MPRPIKEIAQDIETEWSKVGKGVNYAAKPYLDALYCLDTIKDMFFLDDAETVILYFLSNASTFKGEKAKQLKAELKEHLPK